jgi:hypothetical protein
MIPTLRRRARRHRYTISWNHVQLRVSVEAPVSDEARLERELLALGLSPPTLGTLGRQLNAISQQRGLVVTFDRDIVRDRLRGTEVIRVRMAPP